MAVHYLVRAVVLAIHDDQIRLYGGAYGVRDHGALESALAMPQTRFAGHFLHTDIYAMGAAYGFHLAQNRPFVDGNKRAAGMTMLTFLAVNGLEAVAPEMDYYRAMMAVGSGEMTKEALTEWLRSAMRGTPPDMEE